MKFAGFRLRMPTPPYCKRMPVALPSSIRATANGSDVWQDEKTGGIGETIELHPLILLPQREWLYQRCDLRFELMLERGAIAEVEALLARNLSPELPVMRAIGVQEIAAMLRGEMTRDEAVAAGQQATRNYAKRQYTWFRRQPPEDWETIETNNIEIEETFVSLFQI